MKTSLRGRLKSDTAIEHKKIDDLYSKLNLSIFNDYKIFLTAHYIALSSIEGFLKNDFNKTALPPCQTDLIANDLLSLNLKVPQQSIFLKSDDINKLGLSYVISGAHFGAKVLLERALAGSDERIHSSVSYLSSDRMRSYWPKLTAQLKSAASNEKDYHVIVKGANHAFMVFGDSYELALKENFDV